MLHAQIVAAPTSSVEVIGIATASQAAGGLGYGISPNGFTHDYEFAAVQAGGGSWVRFQPSWATYEQQQPAPSNLPVAGAGQYVHPANEIAALTSIKRYNLKAVEVAAYGPPNHRILQLTVTGGGSVAAGATSIPVTFAAGDGGLTMAALVAPFNTFYLLNQDSLHTNPCYGRISTCSGGASGGHAGVAGTLVKGYTATSSTTGTLTLQSATNIALPAGVTLAVNQILYPATATTSATDPSVVAYGNYLMSLMQDCNTRGITCQGEIWNEPVGASDPWDNSCALTDDGSPCPASPGPANATIANFGFVANLQQRTFPANTSAVWNGTYGSGGQSIIAPPMYANTGVYANQQNGTASGVTGESFHPYTGNEGNPTVQMARMDCLKAAAAATTYPANQGNVCLLAQDNSNLWYEVYLNFQQLTNYPSLGVGREVTETNTQGPGPGYRVAQARSNVMQYAGFQGMGLSPIIFFQLYDEVATEADPSFSFMNCSTGSCVPYPGYTAMQGYIADMNQISLAPVAAYSQATLPSVTSYSGTFPLDAAYFVGARAGASANSAIVTLFQRTNCPIPTDGSTNPTCWFGVASPAAGSTTLTLPTGMALTSARDTITGMAVPFTQTSNTATLAVADNPINATFDPVSAVNGRQILGSQSIKGSMVIR